MKITIAGTGYVGLTTGLLFARHSEVTFYDIDQDKVARLNRKVSPISGQEFDQFLENEHLKLSATTDKQLAYKNADIVVVSVPTVFCDVKNTLNTDIVDQVVSDVLCYNDTAAVVIRSTLPVGHVTKLLQRHRTKNIFFSPEFLRQENALNDALNPDRIVIGDDNSCHQEYMQLLQESLNIDLSIFHVMSSKEAEAVKLFSNAYLAMRVAFFNELDTFALENRLNTANVITGVCSDKRIGNYYNKPSSGYAGNCLPKDVKQLASQANEENHELLGAITLSNKKRQRFRAG